MDPRCEELSRPNIANFCFSIIILLGILLSYVPQHVRIIARRTSFGISPYFVLLGTTAGTSGLANILVLPRSATDIGCCKEINGFACLSVLMGVFQLGAQALGFAIILFLFILYFPRATPVEVSKGPNDVPTFRTALFVVSACILHAVATVIISLVFVLAHPLSRQLGANILGVMAAILSSIQYFPQIYTTFRLKRVASLSIPMMCIQTPGGYVWAASLAARLGPEGWSTWGIFVLTATLQGIVLALGVYFEYIKPQKEDVDPGCDTQAEEQEAVAGDEPNGETRAHAVSEDTPLLRDSR